MHFLDQRNDIVDRRFRQDAVSEVEDVSHAPGSAVEQIACVSSHFGLGGKQHHWIKVPLHGKVVAKLGRWAPELTSRSREGPR